LERSIPETGTVGGLDGDPRAGVSDFRRRPRRRVPVAKNCNLELNKGFYSVRVRLRKKDFKEKEREPSFDGWRRSTPGKRKRGTFFLGRQRKDWGKKSPQRSCQEVKSSSKVFRESLGRPVPFYPERGGWRGNLTGQEPYLQGGEIFGRRTYLRKKKDILRKKGYWRFPAKGGPRSLVRELAVDSLKRGKGIYLSKKKIALEYQLFCSRDHVGVTQFQKNFYGGVFFVGGKWEKVGLQGPRRNVLHPEKEGGP